METALSVTLAQRPLIRQREFEQFGGYDLAGFHDLGKAGRHPGFSPDAAFEIAFLSPDGYFLGQDLVAHDHVVEHVGFAHGFPDEFAGAHRGEAESEESGGGVMESGLVPTSAEPRAGRRACPRRARWRP